MDLEPKAERLPYELPQLVTLGSLEEITQSEFDEEWFWWRRPKHHHSNYSPPHCDPYS